MPKATTNVQDTERKDLKTLPEGYVVLRRMTYGEFMKRRQMTSNLSVSGGKGRQDFSGVLELANQKVTEFEFASCVVEHNLEDEEGNLLNFKNPVHLQMLDPRVGEEISSYIDEMNQFNAEEEVGK